MPRISSQTRIGGVRIRSVFTRATVLCAVIILIGGIWAWWHLIYSNPQRVFWGMVNNAMQTTSVARETIQNGEGQTLDQKIQTEIQPQQIANGRNEITQSGAGGFDVVTTVLGTPTADYVRYDTIKTDLGKPQSYKSILGVWAKTEAPNHQTAGQLYNQAVLGVLPFGNLSAAQRKTLINLMQSKAIFQTDFAKTKRAVQNGRPTYSYAVKISPEAYISMLKQYASYVGLNHLSQTNAADYRGTAPLQFQFDIDVWTRELRTVHYANGREEHYSGYGAHVPTTSLPKSTIPIEQLQQRVQATQ